MKQDNLTRQVDVMNGPYMLKRRKEIQPQIQKLGSTARLTFCSDSYDKYIDHIEQKLDI